MKDRPSRGLKTGLLSILALEKGRIRLFRGGYGGDFQNEHLLLLYASIGMAPRTNFPPLWQWYQPCFLPGLVPLPNVPSGSHIQPFLRVVLWMQICSFSALLQSLRTVTSALSGVPQRVPCLASTTVTHLVQVNQSQVPPPDDDEVELPPDELPDVEEPLDDEPPPEEDDEDVLFLHVLDVDEQYRPIWQSWDAKPGRVHV